MSLDFDELNALMAQAHKQAENMMKTLSLEDQKKVNNIVKGVDLEDLDAMSKELEILKTK